MRYRSSSKYMAKAVKMDDHTFDSQGEARRYRYLKGLVEQGIIEDLELQKKYVLIPAQYEEGRITKRGTFKRGKVIERECAYYADFEYTYNGKRIVEDFKGIRLEAYKLKKKLMLWRFNIRIHETRKWDDPLGGEDVT